MLRSLKSKILSIYLFLIFLISFIAIISIVNLYSLNRAIDGLIASNYTSIVAATNMIDAIERQDSNQLIYLEVNQENGIRAFIENQKEFFLWLSRAKDNITEPDEKEILDRISNDYMKYIEYFSKLQETKNTGGDKQATTFYDDEVYPVFHSVKKACKELLLINESAMFASKNKATVNSQTQMYTTIAISIFSILLGFVIAFYFTKKTINPIYMLTSGVKAIKEGNLNQEIEVSTKDEIGELASEFNNMTRRLLQYEKSNIKNLIAERNKSVAIVKSILDPIIVTDNDFKVVLVNKSAETIFDIIEKEVLGNHFLDAINNPKVFKCIKSLVKDSNNPSGAHNEYNDLITVSRQGKEHHYMLTVAPILNDDNNISGTVSVFRDITHLKEVEQLKSNFISTVSHELRTPLTSIIMGVQLLRDNVLGELNDEQGEVIEALNEDGGQLMALIEDLLDLSRIESGKIELNLERISIYEIVQACIKPLQELAQDRGVSLSHDITPAVPQVYADSKKMKCVVNNLITNALKYTKGGDFIKLSAKAEGNMIKVTVRDTGIGIPEEYHKTIFNKFTQVGDLVYGQNGTGLGLAIAKDFIEKQNGEIWVKSKPGEGSSFIFTLPIYKG